jgi:hypothetical protein
MSHLCDRCRPRSGPNEAVDEVDELVIEGGTVGLQLGCTVMVGLWVCCDGGFVGFFMVVCGGGFVLCSGFLIFFFFILRCSKYYKIFFRLFSRMQSNTGKKLFSLKSFTFANISQ